MKSPCIEKLKMYQNAQANQNPNGDNNNPNNDGDPEVVVE